MSKTDQGKLEYEVNKYNKSLDEIIEKIESFKLDVKNLSVIQIRKTKTDLNKAISGKNKSKILSEIDNCYNEYTYRLEQIVRN